MRLQSPRRFRGFCRLLVALTILAIALIPVAELYGPGRMVIIYPAGPQVCRMCRHLDVSREQATRVADAIRAAVPRMKPVRV